MQQILVLFPLWAVLASIIAWFFPAPFVQLQGIILPLLVVIMLAMGMTLSLRDFANLKQMKTVVLIGVGLQFLLMPLAAFVISRMLQLSLELTIGMMLVGVTAGGTASNVITYLAKGNLALSVSMTLVSTLAAVIMMPLLTHLYLGQSVLVPTSEMLISLVKVVVIPIVVGVVLNHFFARSIIKLQDLLAHFATWSIVLIIAIVVAVNNEQLHLVSISLLLAVVLHNLVGLYSGYKITQWLGYDSKTARTVAIEVAMQNSGLSVAIAMSYFSALSALPGALFSVWHNISGALFASYWRRQPTQETLEKQNNQDSSKE